MSRFRLLLLAVVFVLLFTSTSTAAPGDPSLASPRQANADTTRLQVQSANVEFVGQIGGTMNAVALQGNYAYVGVGPRLVILNIANLANPVVVGQTGVLPAIVADVAVAGNYAYVADEVGGLRIIDVSNPAAPTEVGFYDTPGNAYGVAVAGNYAYVADDLDGLRIIDISNPAAPTEVGFYDALGNAWGVAVAGNYAYIAGGMPRAWRWRATTPTSPTSTAACALWMSPTRPPRLRSASTTRRCMHRAWRWRASMPLRRRSF